MITLIKQNVAHNACTRAARMLEIASRKGQSVG